MSWRIVVAAARAQLQMSRHNIEDFFPVLTIPLTAVISLAILQHSRRLDLAGYALVAAGLMSVGQMSFFVASELLARERLDQTLELMVASPTACYLPLLVRICVLTAIGFIGFAEAWAIAWLVFDVSVSIYHPIPFVLTLAATIAAGSVTALITSTVFCFGKTTRTYQNAIAGPLYLLAGVLVPVAFLPEFIQPISRVIFLYWSAELMRASLTPLPMAVGPGLLAIVALGVAGGALGSVLFGRLLLHLRREGTIGL